MKRFFALCVVASLATAFSAGCEMNKKKAEVKDEKTVTTAEGTTTTTDTHKVESSGQTPPANSQGETK